ncbi:MAG: DUF488 domain-containing protein [Candidatus Bathyarchaeota archaeon]|nr:DUF488 domain-containing protein [Candidatus Bathyarchaeota archaeon]
MIRESYLANMRRLPPNALKIVVTATSKSPLAPSWSLIKSWNARPRLLSWQKYQKRYRREISENPEALKLLQKIKTISQHRDVYLICYEKQFPCHRFILLDMIQESRPSDNT